MPQRNAPRQSFVDFKALRKSLSFAAVLESYGVPVKRQKGNRHVGFCPLPTHQGQRKSPSFSAKLDWGVWQCFGCRASGNVLDFAILMEGLDPQDAKHVRRVALKLQEQFGTPTPTAAAPEKPPPPPSPAENRPAPTAPMATMKSLPALVNPPLDFELKNLDAEHPYLAGRGFTPETVQHFGLGYCNRGLMAGRVVIPLHDLDDRLVGYAGRLVDDAQISEYHPKYKFPASRERDGRLLEFRKSLLVYNANRIAWPVNDLIVVEGFAAVWWLTQHGYPNVVALMGASCSPEQAKPIISGLAQEGRVWVLADADDGGEHCAHSVFAEVGPHRCVRWPRPPKRQPTDCTVGDLAALF